MRIIAKRRLREFWELPGRADAEQPLKAWYRVAHAADWTGPADIKRQFRNASILSGRRAVFNISGNKYRLVAEINFPYGVIYLRFVGTHAAYDRIDVETI
jgi:mRNA interferase HigB